MAISREQITDILQTIIDPVSGKNLMDANIIRALTIDGDTVKFVIEVAPDVAPQMEPVRVETVAALQKAGVKDVSAILTAHASKAPPPDLKIGGHPKPQAGPAKVAGSPDGKTIIPLRNHGVTLMSMGLMVAEDEAVVWRGPMLMGALQQMLSQVQWGTLDVMLVDLPPGTGDVQLTLSQKAEVAGAVVVSTPQDIALLDARKALNMFEKVGTPVVGMIENMSTYICPKCGNEEHLFGHGGAQKEAEKLELPFLGEVPLDLSIREAADAGTPIVVAKPDSPQAQAFRSIARKLIENGDI